MILCKSKEDVRKAIGPWKRASKTLGFAPTMGALHEGHLSLIDVVAQNADHTMASIFVNPLQFAPHEDFETYPRVIERDLELLEQRGCDLVFMPERDALFAPDFSTRVIVENVTQDYCGAARPHFFEGVATIVTKLLMIMAPDIAVFGEKDYQQLTTIKRLVRDLDMPIEIFGAPTVREDDGIAMSSRNQYLSAEERAVAPLLYETITAAAEKITTSGEKVETVSDWAINRLTAAGFSKVDYFSFADAETLEPFTNADRPGRILVAAWLGKTRLIDNAPMNNSAA